MTPALVAMRLGQFIREHTEEILVEWEAFARTVPTAAPMDIGALRDHAKAMLGVIARDLETPQTVGEESAKAAGKADAAGGGRPTTAAQEHGAARAGSGFSVEQMLSELRALRASVIRLWTRANPQNEPTDFEDMVRFNEAIDQAIAESISQYASEIGKTRDRFIAILGHDLRNPLGAIITSAQFIMELGKLGEPHDDLVGRIASSAQRMNEMVGVLLDLTQTTLGAASIPITRANTDVAKLVRDVVLEVRARYPASVLEVETPAELVGSFDGARLSQALTNLVSNAVQHGAKESPITVTARGTKDDVVISVHNDGPVISPEQMSTLFKPGNQTSQAKGGGHFGLGLFIADRIVAAHHGRIDVRSTTADGTTFTIHLPLHEESRVSAEPGARVGDEPGTRRQRKAGVRGNHERQRAEE